MKEKIMQLRAEGLSYNAIVKEVGCAKSTVCYYCGDRQREKITERTRQYRKENPGIRAVETFCKEIPHYYKPIYSPDTLKNAKKKIINFHASTKVLTAERFNYKDMMQACENNQCCYLTGRPVDLIKGAT